MTPQRFVPMFEKISGEKAQWLGESGNAYESPTIFLFYLVLIYVNSIILCNEGLSSF
jgi:hypothetical protein